MSRINTGLAGAATGAAIGGPIGAAAGGIGGYLLGQDDTSQNTISDLIAQAQNIPLPILKEYYPELYAQVVSLNPELQSEVILGPSEMAGIATDPALRQAQLNALNKLQGIGAAGGQDAQFLANQARTEADINANLQGQMGAIQQNLAARGLGGGMTEMVQRNIAAQGGANRQAQMGMDARAQAEQRALQALMQSGQLAGGMQSQDFGQQASKAQAADAIARFNAQNRQNVLNTNVGLRNEAQMYNAGQAQNIANQNVGLRNQQQQYNLNIPQQQYQNQLGKYGLASGATTNLAGMQRDAARSQDQFLGNLFASGATAYAANKKKEKLPGEV